MLSQVERETQRHETDFDLFLHGTVFLDIVLTGMPQLPSPGTELHADGMGSCPGGIANLAVAAGRLGLRTSLAAAFGDDVYGDFLWRTLADQEGVDLSYSHRFADWHSPVTVSLADARDRAMVTHSHPAPGNPAVFPDALPAARAAVMHIDEGAGDWVARTAANGMRVFADVGWDDTGRWPSSLLDQLSDCYGFLPNSVEAMAYTRTDDPDAALRRLADSVGLVVVTCGGQGAMAVDGHTGEEGWVPALPVNAIDATGAGDVFCASFVLGTLRGWPLRERLAFANLSASLAVQQVGGSLAAPGWGDIADWFDATRTQAHAGSRNAQDWLERYGFLAELLPQTPAPAVRRARATIARASDA